MVLNNPRPGRSAQNLKFIQAAYKYWSAYFSTIWQARDSLCRIGTVPFASFCILCQDWIRLACCCLLSTSMNMNYSQHLPGMIKQLKHLINFDPWEVAPGLGTPPQLAPRRCHHFHMFFSTLAVKLSNWTFLSQHPPLLPFQPAVQLQKEMEACDSPWIEMKCLKCLKCAAPGDSKRAQLQCPGPHASNPQTPWEPVKANPNSALGTETWHLPWVYFVVAEEGTPKSPKHGLLCSLIELIYLQVSKLCCFPIHGMLCGWDG